MRVEDQCLANRTYDVAALNYPSFAVQLPAGGGTATHPRTATNVGRPGTYRAAANVTVAAGRHGPGPAAAITVKVEPAEMRFSQAGEKQSYSVSFTSGAMTAGTVGFGRLVWTSDMYVVSSPIIIIKTRKSRREKLI
ncbi:hypothetical protein C2845_PM03G17820 [Panicum miliaceum]|uniref:Subtilisin-like protease fibronectin type-III domain-containing protein n=1 Tax=Panicum miliaceum TaxID=4540 RepID=A0A3L6TD63_PANMI|nr:hypothetical protein C2845_PM03G17820 [Panicum miliaceum]